MDTVVGEDNSCLVDVYKEQKKFRKQVAKGIINFCNSYIPVEPSGTIKYSNTELSKILNSYGKVQSNVQSNYGHTYIEVTNEDTFVAGTRLSRLYNDIRKPVVLNMANAKYIGGGFINGARAQEEELCRRSNLYQCLLSNKELYPMKEYDTIYTKSIYVIADTNYQLYEPNEWTQLAVVSAAAYNKPPVIDGHLDMFHMTGMEMKIEQVLNVALINNHVDIVLSAWGCGAFRNPPVDIANIFKKLLSTTYKNQFRHVVFAVYDTSETSENYVVFKNIITGAEN